MGGPRVGNLLNSKLNEIKNLRENSNSYKTISEIIGCSETTIRKFCIDNQIDGNVKNKIIGQVFEKSNLEVLELDLNPPFQSHETAYKCRCAKCGEVKTYRKTNIVEGPGCHKCEGYLGGRGYREWEVGQKFGFIEILGRGERNGYVVGKCVCGTVREFALQNLKGRGHSRTISCGCKQQSAGEFKIATLLEENGVNFKTQYRIDDFSLYSLFDFAIFDDDNNLIKLIEFDGEQHFEPVEHFGGEEKFLIQKERDERKNKYCEENNIPLLRIPYWDYQRIDMKYLFS